MEPDQTTPSGDTGTETPVTPTPDTSEQTPVEATPEPQETLDVTPATPEVAAPETSGEDAGVNEETGTTRDYKIQ